MTVPTKNACANGRSSVTSSQTNSPPDMHAISPQHRVTPTELLTISSMQPRGPPCTLPLAHDLRRALVAFVVSAAVAARSLYVVMRFTDGFETVQGILGTVVGSALVLMVLLARAGERD